MKARCAVLPVVLLATACGGGADGAAVFERAQRGLGRVQAIRAHLVVLPSLPFDPGSVDSAKVEIVVGRNDGLLRRARLEGDLHGVHFAVDLEIAS